MKSVLVIDESALFREYLKLKLEENNLEVTLAINGLDGVSKIYTMPDLIIMDYHLSRLDYRSVLEQKKSNPNTARIPVIVTAPRLEQHKIIELASYNVRKVFNKPVKIDALFKTLESLLGITFSIDNTPSIIDCHLSDRVIFVEIAKGLNRDKIDLLRFKLAELLEIHQVRNPRMLIMMSDMKLEQKDGENLGRLLTTAQGATKIPNRYIRILTMDSFVGQYIRDTREFLEIETVTDLNKVLNQFIGTAEGENTAERIGNTLLQTSELDRVEQLRFEREPPPAVSAQDIRELIKDLRIAAVDDDQIILGLIQNTFSSVGSTVVPFTRGEAFLKAAEEETFDLVFLDLMMPGMNGFAILRELLKRQYESPVIVLSANTQREIVIQAFQLGIKSYLIKPLKPQEIFAKSLEILKANF